MGWSDNLQSPLTSGYVTLHRQCAKESPAPPRFTKFDKAMPRARWVSTSFHFTYTQPESPSTQRSQPKRRASASAFVLVGYEILS